MSNDNGSGREDQLGTNKERPATARASSVKKTSAKARQAAKGAGRGGLLQEWRKESQRLCDPAGKNNPRVFRLEHLKQTVASVRSGALLLAEAEKKGVHFVYDPQTAASHYYPGGPRPLIALNPDREPGELVHLLARELRRVWQDQKGALVSPLNYEPDEAVLLYRAQVADTIVAGVRVAWELKLAGNAESWDFLLRSSLADMGRIFEMHAQTDFRTLNSGVAARAAYDKFFEEGRTKPYDKRLIHQMLLDENGYMRRCSTTRTARVDLDLLGRLGQVPDEGRNYLMVKEGRLPHDPIYALVDDRSNANFLWFIKFERNFHEKEAEMLQQSLKISGEIVEFARKAETEPASPSVN